MKSTISMAMKVTNYLSYRHSLGYELKWEGKALVDFGHYADQSGHQGPLTLALALKWARLPAEADPGYWARRLTIRTGPGQISPTAGARNRSAIGSDTGSGMPAQNPAHLLRQRDRPFNGSSATSATEQRASTTDSLHNNRAPGQHRYADLGSASFTRGRRGSKEPPPYSQGKQVPPIPAHTVARFCGCQIGGIPPKASSQFSSG